MIGSSTARAAEAGANLASPRGRGKRQHAPRGPREGADRDGWGRGSPLGGGRGGLGVVCRGPGAGRYGSLADGDDGRRLPLHFLVEDVLGLRLRQGVPVGYGLDRCVVPRGRPAGRADARRLGRLADSQENAPHRGGLGDEGDDAQVGTAVRADQRLRTRTGVRAAWPTGSAPGRGNWVPRQRAVSESGPHRARRRWRPGVAGRWVRARHGSGGGAAAAGGSGQRGGR